MSDKAALEALYGLLEQPLAHGATISPIGASIDPKTPMVGLFTLKHVTARWNRLSELYLNMVMNSLTPPNWSVVLT